MARVPYPGSLSDRAWRVAIISQNADQVSGSNLSLGVPSAPTALPPGNQSYQLPRTNSLRLQELPFSSNLSLGIPSQVSTPLPPGGRINQLPRRNATFLQQSVISSNLPLGIPSAPSSPAASVGNFAALSGAGAATYNLAFTGPVTAGSTLRASVRTGSSITLNTIFDNVNASVPWVLLGPIDNGAGRQYTAYFQNTLAGTPTVTVQISGVAVARIAIWEIVGALPVSFDVTAGNIGTGSPLTGGATATTAQANEVWDGAFSNAAVGTFSQNGPWTILGTDPVGATARIAVVYQIVSTIGNPNAATNDSGGSAWIGQTGAFRVASSTQTMPPGVARFSLPTIRIRRPQIEFSNTNIALLGSGVNLITSQGHVGAKSTSTFQKTALIIGVAGAGARATLSGLGKTGPVGDQQYDLTPRTPLRLRDYTWIKSLIPTLVGQDALPVGDQQFALVTPRALRLSDYSIAQSTSLLLIASQTVGEQQYELPTKAPARQPANIAFYSNNVSLLLNGLILPNGTQFTDLPPAPAPRRARDYSVTQSLTLNLRGQDARLVGQQNYDLPPRGPRRARDYTYAYSFPLTLIFAGISFYRNTRARFALRAQNYRDTNSRFKLASATTYRDTNTRYKLRAQNYRDTRARFALRSNTIYRDTRARFALGIQNYRDTRARFNLRGQVYRDTRTRFALRSATVYRDTNNRYKLQSVARYRDTNARYRLRAQRYRDNAARYKLQSVTRYRDTSAMFSLFGNVFRDNAARMSLQSLGNNRDTGARFGLRNPSRIREAPLIATAQNDSRTAAAIH